MRTGHPAISRLRGYSEEKKANTSIEYVLGIAGATNIIKAVSQPVCGRHQHDHHCGDKGEDN